MAAKTCFFQRSIAVKLPENSRMQKLTKIPKGKEGPTGGVSVTVHGLKN